MPEIALSSSPVLPTVTVTIFDSAKRVELVISAVTAISVASALSATESLSTEMEMFVGASSSSVMVTVAVSMSSLIPGTGSLSSSLGLLRMIRKVSSGSSITSSFVTISKVLLI